MSTITVDVTMKELHRYFAKFQIANPTIQEPAAVITAAICNRWPWANPDSVLREAEINWLRQDRKDMVRAAGRDMSKWVDTTVQGDLFNDYPVKVPQWFMIDGEPQEYWKVSIEQALSYLQARESALRAEAGALEQAAGEKHAMADTAKWQVKRTVELIQMAEERGVAPRTVKYARTH